MRVLRFYEAGNGDCIAVRVSSRTPLIFDTGQRGAFSRSCSRGGCWGFGLALYDAVGAPSHGRAPPVVVLSHVDEDHVGGLQEWIAFVLASSSSPQEAARRAQREVRSVYCNVPPDLRLFVSDDDSPPHSVCEVREPLERLDALFDVLERREALARTAFGGKAPDRAAAVRSAADDESDRRSVVGWVEEASRAIAELETPGPEVGGRPQGLPVAVKMDRDRVVIQAGDDVAYETTVRGEAAATLRGGQEFEAAFEATEREVASIRQSESALEALTALSKLAPRPRLGAPASMEGLRTVAMLGLTDAKSARSSLSMFSALRRVGIRVHHACSTCAPELAVGIRARVLLPASARLDALFNKWEALGPRLRIPFPTFGATYFTGMALFMFSPDRSVTNLSSIALLLTRVGPRGSVVLTGDGLHCDVIAALRVPTHAAGVRARSLHFQIPHHGGARNTDCAHDVLPRDALGSSGEIAAAIASGGRETIELTGRGPRRQVLVFHERGARRVIATRPLSRRDGFLDIRVD